MTRKLLIVAMLAVTAGVGSYRWQPFVYAQRANTRVPQYDVDPSWPPKLPNNWIFGVPTWVAIDRRGHVWVLHRPRTAPQGQRANAAPPVIEFDPAGKFVQAWGG